MGHPFFRADWRFARSRSFAPLTPRTLTRPQGPKRADSQDDKDKSKDNRRSFDSLRSLR
jgi:hypothetical protein